MLLYYHRNFYLSIGISIFFYFISYPIILDTAASRMSAKRIHCAAFGSVLPVSQLDMVACLTPICSASSFWFIPAIILYFSIPFGLFPVFLKCVICLIRSIFFSSPFLKLLRFVVFFIILQFVVFVNRKIMFCCCRALQAVATFSHAIASLPRPPSPQGQSPCPSKTNWQGLPMRCWRSGGEGACNTLA